MSVIRHEPGAVPSTWLPSTLRHPRYILMLFAHVSLDIPNGGFLYCLPNFCMHFLSPPIKVSGNTIIYSRQKFSGKNG